MWNDEDIPDSLSDGNPLSSITFLSLAQLHLLHGQHGQGDGLLGGALQEADEDHQPSVDIENVAIR